MRSQAPRLYLLGAILLAGFCATLLLPDVTPMRASMMRVEMPPKLGEWESTKIPISERELSVLADDTVFERRVFELTTSSDIPTVEASVVFSGKDMNNSIHRPEVCLRTQGWNFVRERYVELPKMLPDGSSLTVREIVCSKTRRDPETGEPVQLPNGKFLTDWQILYYTFIGATNVTASHYGRVFIDIRDRVLNGFDQQWAYATFSSLIPGKYHDQGVNIGALEPLDIDGTGRHLETFMRQLLPDMLTPPDQTSRSTAP